MELFAGLIADDPGQSDQWVSNLRAGIRLLSGTVNNVLSIHCGTVAPLKPLDLNACVASAVEFVQPIANQAGLQLVFQPLPTRPIVRGDENAIRQVILNLVCNAIRHTAAGGEIRVSIHDWHQGPLVEVSDTGCGIPASMLEHLFDAGFSGEGNTPGLGLAVCKRLATQHGGAIRVSSRVNEGTTFQVEFPAYEQ
jgi:signal transduction histidine kinase